MGGCHKCHGQVKEGSLQEQPIETQDRCRKPGGDVLHCLWLSDWGSVKGMPGKKWVCAWLEGTLPNCKSRSFHKNVSVVPLLDWLVNQSQWQKHLNATSMNRPAVMFLVWQIQEALFWKLSVQNFFASPQSVNSSTKISFIKCSFAAWNALANQKMLAEMHAKMPPNA